MQFIFANWSITATTGNQWGSFFLTSNTIHNPMHINSELNPTLFNRIYSQESLHRIFNARAHSRLPFLIEKKIKLAFSLPCVSAAKTRETIRCV